MRPKMPPKNNSKAIAGMAKKEAVQEEKDRKAAANDEKQLAAEWAVFDLKAHVYRIYSLSKLFDGWLFMF